MATENSEKFLGKIKDIAKKHFERLKFLSRIVRSGPMEAGWITAQMKTKNEFQALGFEKEPWKKLQFERSTWYRYQRIAGGYQKLQGGLREFLQLFPGKAEIGLRLPESERWKQKWLDRMKDPELIEDDFEAMVDKAIGTGEVKQDATSAEERDWWKIRAYTSQIEVYDRVLRKFCEVNELGDDKSRALELALADIETGLMGNEDQAVA